MTNIFDIIILTITFALFPISIFTIVRVHKRTRMICGVNYYDQILHKYGPNNIMVKTFKNNNKDDKFFNKAADLIDRIYETEIYIEKMLRENKIKKG